MDEIGGKGEDEGERVLSKNDKTRNRVIDVCSNFIAKETRALLPTLLRGRSTDANLVLFIIYWTNLIGLRMNEERTTIYDDRSKSNWTTRCNSKNADRKVSTGEKGELPIVGNPSLEINTTESNSSK